VSINCPSICGRACASWTAGMSSVAGAHTALRDRNAVRLGYGSGRPAGDQSQLATRADAAGLDLQASRPVRPCRRSRDRAARLRRRTPGSAGSGRGEHGESVRRGLEPRPSLSSFRDDRRLRQRSAVVPRLVTARGWEARRRRSVHRLRSARTPPYDAGLRRSTAQVPVTRRTMSGRWVLT
jgi:hypothetical protein